VVVVVAAMLLQETAAVMLRSRPVVDNAGQARWAQSAYSRGERLASRALALKIHGGSERHARLRAGAVPRRGLEQIVVVIAASDVDVSVTCAATTAATFRSTHYSSLAPSN
jgi:hypothetical protein